MSEKMGTCETCEQWKQETYGRGECRNRSPVVDPQAKTGWSGDDPTYGPRTLWPITERNDWCADHLGKIDEVQS